MVIVNSNHQVIVLFDEQGTPTFRKDRETDYFLGVATTYRASDERGIFKTCSELFGLKNKKPLKNQRINKLRAIEIAKMISKLPVNIFISSIDLSDTNYKDKVEFYMKCGNVDRRKYRGDKRGRKINQILHTRSTSNCLFKSIANYYRFNKNNLNFDVFIDDWSYPTIDKDIELNYNTESIKDLVNELGKKFGKHNSIDVSTISLLNEDNKRKRFIDVVTSSISRSFLNKKNQKYTQKPLNIILTVKINQWEDITQDELKICENMTQEIIEKWLKANRPLI